MWDAASSTVVRGRFGWKANQPSLAQQDRGAFLGDMGLTSDLFSGECAPGQDACAAEPSGGEPEVSPQIAELVDTYVRLLAPPARRDVEDAEVLRGHDRSFSEGADHTETIPDVDAYRFCACDVLDLDGDGRDDVLLRYLSWDREQDRITVLMAR